MSIPQMRSEQKVGRPCQSTAAVDSEVPLTTPLVTTPELKDLLTGFGIDFSSCIEKTDLQNLLERFISLRMKPLTELRAACAVAGATPTSIFPGDIDACARFLLVNTTPDSANPGSTSSSAHSKDKSDGTASQSESACPRADSTSKHLATSPTNKSIHPGVSPMSKCAATNYTKDAANPRAVATPERTSSH